MHVELRGINGHIRELADGLSAAGHHPQILRSRTLQLPEKALRFRGFAGPLTHVPFSVAALRRGGFHIAHAFSPQDALATLAWRRLAGRPAVFSCPAPVTREALADRRLSLWLLERAIEDSDAVVAPTEESRAALSRWLAIDVPLLEPRDAAGYERMYRDLLAARA